VKERQEDQANSINNNINQTTFHFAAGIIQPLSFCIQVCHLFHDGLNLG
jgi:hypothetical protein